MQVRTCRYCLVSRTKLNVDAGFLKRLQRLTAWRASRQKIKSTLIGASLCEIIAMFQSDESCFCNPFIELLFTLIKIHAQMLYMCISILNKKTFARIKKIVTALTHIFLNGLTSDVSDTYPAQKRPSKSLLLPKSIPLCW